MSTKSGVPVVILAAGVGRRLGALTAIRPKALLDVGGTTLLARQLQSLERAGFERVVVVTGHGDDQVRIDLAGRAGRLVVQAAYNPDFARANNIVSLLVARPYIEEGFCLLNSDIIFEPSIATDLAAAPAGSWLVVDRDEPLGAEEMKVELDSSQRVTRISKLLDPARSAGEYIGAARFDAAGARALVASMERLVGAGEVDLYYEDAVDRAADAIGAGILETRGRAWTEVDDLADLDRAVDIAARLGEGMIA